MIPAIPVLELLKAGPVAVLAVGVWYEVHEMRTAVTDLTASVAVLMDRADCSTPAHHVAPVEPPR